MTSITVVTVGANAQPLAPAPVAGAQAQAFTIINLDTANTVVLGSLPSQLTFPLGPLASVTLTAPVWAAAATEALQVGIVPGGSAFSPGSLTINGPVTAEITGPVEVEGTVAISGTVDASVTGTVEITGTPSVEIAGTPSVEISGTTTVDLASGSEIEINNSSIDVIGAGGYIMPGLTSTIYTNASAITITEGTTETVVSEASVESYSSLDISLNSGVTVSTSSTGTAAVMPVGVTFYDSNGYYIAGNVYNVPLGWGGANGGTAQFSIPCRGALVTVELFNIGTAGTITVSASDLNVSGSYRSLDNVQYTCANPNTGTFNDIVYSAGSDNSDSVATQWVAQITAPAMTTGDVNAYTLTGYSGEVKGWFRSNGAALQVLIVDIGCAATIGGISNAGNGNSGVIYATQTAADATEGEIQYLDLYLPPSPCIVITSAVAASDTTFNLQLMGM
jgi:hypothetical protein